MADQIISQLRTLVEGQIDFQGQKKTELITSLVLAGSGLFALLIGYIQQDIHLTLWLGLLGTFLAFVMVVPPWPIYNEDPERWLPGASGVSGGPGGVGTGLEGVGIVVDGKKIN